MSHTIRLRGPWEFSIAGTEIAGRIDLPCDWGALLGDLRSANPGQLFAAEKGAVTVQRHFHLPTGLEPGNRVLIVLRWHSPHVVARLNGAKLALEEQSDGSHQADVTGRLAPGNQLTVDLEPPCPAPTHSRAPILEASLQID